MSSAKAILFLGSTGGVCNSALRRSLAAGLTCVALVRSSKKLTDMLPSSTPGANLTIIEGDARDVAALQRALTAAPGPSRIVDLVVSSVGSYPSIRNMGANADPTLCADSMRALVSAISSAVAAAPGSHPPRVVAVSTTGISSHARDVPLAFVGLYKVALASAHKDKKAMENVLVQDADGRALPPTPGSARPDFTVIRGSLYVGGTADDKPPAVIRSGVEDPYTGVVKSKAIGYTISREDVGRWIFEHVLKDDVESKQYINKMVMVTY